MVFGGLQKQSLIDFPGKVSCVLFLSGCNFDCPYCHNPSLARGFSECPHREEEGAVFEFLEQRKGFLDGVVISGGEPTLQKDLVDLCGRIKGMGYPVKVDTNGSRPRVIAGLIKKGLVDYIAMDIKTDPFSYAPLIQKECRPRDLLDSIDIIMTSGLPYEFKTTCIRALVDDEVVENICMLIQGARLYALQQFHSVDVLHPEFFRDPSGLFEDADLQRFKRIADPHVERCIVR